MFRRGSLLQAWCCSSVPGPQTSRRAVEGFPGMMGSGPCLGRRVWLVLGVGSEMRIELTARIGRRLSNVKSG
jgi:hypothetical protein